MTLLAIVFAAGGLFVKQQFVESKLGAVVDRFDSYAKTSDARLRIVEDWRIQMDAEKTTEARLERDRKRDERQREERKRRTP